MDHHLFILSAAFIFGACIGSFLNVCIYRIPVSESIVSPGSRCPECGSPVKFYDNIPILSYFLLRGRCRQCKTKFSFRYVLVECITGMLAVSLLLRFGLSIEALAFFTFASVLLVATFIDIDHRIIPDILTLPGIPIFFIASFAVASVSWLDSLLGVIAGGGSLLVVAFIYNRISGKDGMGGGDVKLLAMIGTMVGLKGVLFTIFSSSLLGTLTGLILMIKTGRNLKLAVPFGPFLSIGSILYIFFGESIIRWYLSLLQ